MRRFLAPSLVLLALAAPAFGLRVAFQPPLQRALSAQAVLVGKVTAVEKDPVEVAAGPNKQAYRVAVVKVQTPLAGVDGVTHVKIGFVPRQPVTVAPADPNVPAVRPAIARIDRGFGAPELKEGQEFLFFLTKHPTAGFFQMSPMAPPIEAGSEEGKTEVASIRAAMAVIADPMAALKADKPDARYRAAAVLVSKYRSYPAAGGNATQEPVPADESKRILAAIAEADWAKPAAGLPAPQAAMSMLGLTPQDGWKQPQFKPGQDFQKVMKDAYAQWLAGPGKDYRVKKFVPAAQK